MTALVSTRTMVTQLAGMLGTGQLTPAAERFITDLIARRDARDLAGTVGAGLTQLNANQLEWLEKLHEQHFA